MPEETKPEKIVYKNEEGKPVVKATPPANAPAGEAPVIVKAQIHPHLDGLRDRQIVNADLISARDHLEAARSNLCGYSYLDDINASALRLVDQAIKATEAMSRKVMANDTTKADDAAPISKANVAPVLPPVEKKLDSVITPRPSATVIDTAVEKNDPTPVAAWDWGKIAKLSINSGRRK